MPDDHLYETDFYAWTRQQAAALRRLTVPRSNTALDVDHLAEEIEDLGDNALDVVEGNLTQALAHLLKLEWLPLADPRRHWRKEIKAFRVAAHRRLRRSPTLTGLIDMTALYADARHLIEDDLAEHGIDPALLPADCPYTLAQLLDYGFLPVNRQGLD